MTSTRSGLRSGRLKTAPNTPAAKINLEGILTRVRGESSKLNSMILGNEESPEKQKGINSFLEPISASAVVYPSLDSMASKGDSGNLYPSLDSRTPTRRAAFSATTSKKKRQGVLEEDTCFVTPSRTGHFTIPRNSSFNFEANSGLGEAGKKIMEELKLSSAVVKAQMCPGSSVKASPMANPKTPGKGPRKRRFSDAHSKQFAQMDSIASHYAVRKPKPNTTRTVKLLSPPSPQSPKTPARTLKRKAPVQTPTQLGSPFKISQDAPTISESEDQESPLPARKRAKGETPGGKNVTKIPRYLGTPNVPMAGHLHGLSRSVSVKQAAKKPATPRPNDDDEPVTPAKPVALGTPIKAATLLASPTKIRPPSTVISKPTMPSTPSPVKSSVPISVSGFSFRNNSKAPLFPRLGGRTKPELGTPASKVNLSATAPDLENISPRVLFPEQMGIKRRAEDDADSLYPATTATPARKRVRIDIPEFSSLLSSPAPAMSPRRGSPSKPTGIRKSRLNMLSTPKRRSSPTKPTATTATPSRPIWR